MTSLNIKTLQDAKQACFTGSVRGLAWQKWKRCQAYGISVLRGKGGMNCAIGWLCPPNPLQLNSCGAETALLSGWLHPEIDRWYRQDASRDERDAFKAFLIDLQWLHDAAADMRARFLRLGGKEGLTWPKDVK